MVQRERRTVIRSGSDRTAPAESKSIARWTELQQFVGPGEQVIGLVSLERNRRIVSPRYRSASDPSLPGRKNIPDLVADVHDFIGTKILCHQNLPDRNVLAPDHERAVNEIEDLRQLVRLKELRNIDRGI